MPTIDEIMGGGVPEGEAVGMRIDMVVVDELGQEQYVSVTVNASGGWELADVVDQAIEWVNDGNLGQRSGATYDVTVLSAEIGAVIEGGLADPALSFT